MHAVKVGWGGQTFALANCSDSGGKKSRIRRSKEERKAMVVSFIKKYQKSNNGNFPSLNLTHKEVGGSFYTVREIVREIIQENRVLGPAKLTVEVQNTDQISEQYPLGSISTSHLSHLSLSSDGTDFISNEPQIFTEEVISTSNRELSREEQHRDDKVENINGISVDRQQYEETDTIKSSQHMNVEMLHTDVKISHERVQSSFKSAPEFSPLETDIVVETFPLRSAAILTQDSERRSGEEGNLSGHLDVQGKEVEVASEEKSGYLLDRMESMEKHLTGSMDEKSTADLADPSFESSSSSSVRNIRTYSVDGLDLQVDVPCKDDLTLGAADQTQGSAEIQPKLAPDDICTKSADPNNTISTREESVIIESKADTRNTFSNDEARSSTLNRAKLESWEGASKRPAREEDNPIFAVFRAFISAFVKFWTE